MEAEVPLKYWYPSAKPLDAASQKIIILSLVIFHIHNISNAHRILVGKLSRNGR
jgi:hypothetical protein